MAAVLMLASVGMAQRTPTHPLDIKDANFSDLVSNFSQWEAGQPFGGLSTIDEQFYISRQRPLARISGDNDTLQEASMDLGANRVQTFWRVTIPSIMPGIMSAAFLSFTLSIDDVIMSNMLASARQSTLPVLILSVNRTGITPDINALTTLMVLVMVFGMLIMNFIQRRIAAKEAREIAESEKRISAMSEHG